MLHLFVGGAIGSYPGDLHLYSVSGGGVPSCHHHMLTQHLQGKSTLPSNAAHGGAVSTLLHMQPMEELFPHSSICSPWRSCFHTPPYAAHGGAVSTLLHMQPMEELFPHSLHMQPMEELFPHSLHMQPMEELFPHSLHMQPMEELFPHSLHMQPMEELSHSLHMQPMEELFAHEQTSVAGVSIEFLYFSLDLLISVLQG